MRIKKLLALLLASFLVFGAAACGSDSDESSSDEASTEEGSSTDEESTDEESTDEESTDEESTDEESMDEESMDDESDLGDLPLNMGDCLNVSLTYAGIYLSVLGGEDAVDEAVTALGEIKGDIPEDLQDDLDVIADGIQGADNLSDLGDFFETDEYKEADENIQAYFEEECGG